MIIAGIDGGNCNVKIYGDRGEMTFASAIGEYRERKLEQKFSENDMIFEYKGQKGFAGTLAEYESQFALSMKGDSKAHEEFIIRVLLGLHKYAETDRDARYKIVVGQPISKHTKAEKLKMKQMLQGEHLMTVNDVTKRIIIEAVEVAAEGGASFWSAPIKGLVRILDFGSGTVNGATLKDAKYIDRDSFTLSEGLNTLLNDDVSELVRAVSIRALRRWKANDKVLICGGGAEQVLEHLTQYFSQVDLLRPKIQIRDGNKMSVQHLSPIYANAVGFYNIAKKVFSEVTADEENS